MRAVEAVSFILGVLILAAYGLSEVLVHLGWKLGPHSDTTFPWGQIIVGALLVAPKMLGRATAGKIWDAIGQKFGGKESQ